ncbi:unnamed protein product, partial [Pylaiella littoralis]
MKYNFFGNILSTYGNFHICSLNNSYLKQSLNYISVDILLNHPVWTGKRPK